jgi:hypothetical protein
MKPCLYKYSPLNTVLCTFMDDGKSVSNKQIFSSPGLVVMIRYFATAQYHLAAENRTTPADEANRQNADLVILNIV